MTFFRHSRALILVLLIAAAPGVCIVVAALAIPWTPVFPADLFEPSKGEPQAVAQVLSALSLSLTSIAVAAIAGAAVLARDARHGRRLAFTLAALVVIFSLLSIYCGYEFQFALAAQLNEWRISMSAIEDRLQWQAIATLGSASVLIAMAAMLYWTIEPSVKVSEDPPRRPFAPHQRR